MHSKSRRDAGKTGYGRAKTFLPIEGDGGVAPRGVARVIRAGGVAAVCVIVGLWLGSGQAAASSWTLEQVRVPALPYGQLFGVSCRSASWCIAVGSIPDSAYPGAIERPLIERWDGSRWIDESEPEPAGATEGVLTAVSCASERACVAVGWYTETHGSHAGLVERWNGANWSIQAPLTSGPGLDAVSCPSVRFCVAVGGSVFESWKGSRWSLRRSVRGALLVAVSCVSRRACAAVGSRRGKTLGESFNGSRWSVERTPNPVAGNFGRGTVNVRELSGVSCTSVSACTAVGASTSYCNYCNDEADISLALRWDGRSWRRERSPTFDDLSVISCTSSRACLALSDSPGVREFAYRWNGSRWKKVRVAGFPSLYDVSCASPKACTVVGSLGIDSAGSNLTFAARSDGHRLVRENTSTAADRPTRAALAGVSCTSAADCTAVGSFENGNGQALTLVEHWDGSSWSFEPAPGTGLTSVSCPSTAYCVAVGNTTCLSGASCSGTSVIERWDGAGWTIEPAPKPAGAAELGLSSVSCTSVTACTAVGYVEVLKPNGGGSGFDALVERWNGTSWTLEGTPPTSQTLYDGLTGVSCVSSTFCAAVGPYSTQSDVWNGSSWTGEDFEQPPQPTPQSALVASIYGVSCISPSACVAVGKVNQENAPPLAESWNASNWTIQSTQPTTIPASNLTGSLLTDVSCVSLDACLAVGPDSTDNADMGPLAEAWNGSSWIAQMLPKTNFLPMFSGVSCTASLSCMAVGQLESDGQDGLVGEGPLVAHYS